MIDLDILDALGISPKGLKAKFVAREGVAPLEESVRTKIETLRKRISSRIKSGREMNLTEARIFQALDMAWTAPFRQITPTLLQSLIDRDPNSKEVTDILKSWELDVESVIVEVEDPKTKTKKKAIDIPSFFKITVPLVRCYLIIRWAKLMTQRRKTPFLNYEPVISDLMSRLQCELITNRIDVMSQQYGYFNVVKQGTLQMLQYSKAFQFPEREWDYEEQWKWDDSAPAPVAEVSATESDPNAPAPAQSTEQPDTDTNVKTVTVGGKKRKIKKYVVKEGIPYHLPHPSRAFHDGAHRPSTFNTDSGCQFAGYWRMLRYRDILGDDYYNTDKVNIGATDWWTGITPLLEMLYGKSVIKMPVPATNLGGDREQKMADQYYTSDQGDASVMVTEYFEKLNPKANGLGDYDGMVWFRFVVAGDDTIIYAAPLPYCPIVYYGYEGDENKSLNPSLALEILPFQDHFSNLITQHLLTVKQNLVNATFVDTDVVGNDWIDRLKSYGERIWRQHNFIPFSGKKAQKSQSNVPHAFHSHRFQPLDTAGLIQAMRILLDTMERVLVISAQEAGAAASHEQTKAEINVSEKNTSIRVDFTGFGLDDAIDAMEVQLYKGLMAYGEPEFYAQIPMDNAVTDEVLKKLGVELDGDRKPLDGDRKLTVKAKLSHLELHAFARNMNGNDRTNNVEMAVALANAFTGWLNGPLGPAIGPDQAIKVVNIIGRLAGFPRDFKLENMTPKQSPQEQAAMVKQQLGGFIDEIKQSALTDVKALATRIIQVDNQQDAEIMRILEALRLPPLPPQQTTNAPVQPANPVAPEGPQGPPASMAVSPGIPPV